MFKFLRKLFGPARPAAYPHLDDVDVDIIVRWKPDGKPDYDLDIKDHGFKGGPNGKGVKPKQSTGCLIHFELPSGSGDIRFDAAQPIFYAMPGGGYPSGFAPDQQLLVYRCDADDLEVIDWNSTAGTIAYQLNFTTLAGVKLDAFDPVIINSGGGIKPLLR